MNKILDSAALDCLERTRSAVLNLLVLTGLAMAIGGWILARRDRGALFVPPTVARYVFYVTLLGLVVTSETMRRILGSRAALNDPKTRAERFLRAHLTAAAIGALAMPLGFAFGYAIEPQIKAVVPFWVTAMLLGFLALPRSEELMDYSEPMIPPPARRPVL
jgi:hypothetical protein